MKAPSILKITVVLLGMALAACGAREQNLPSYVITGLQEQFNQNDPAAAAELFTEDGAIMAEFGEVVRGREEIRKFLNVELNKRLQYWITSESSAVTGDVAYDIGNMRIRDTSKGVDLSNGKYMSIYHKENGAWKIYRTIYNSNSTAICDSAVEVGEQPGAENLAE